MMRRLTAATASAALVLTLCATTAHADSTPAEFVTVSGPMTVHDISDDETQLWEAYATLECPEGTVAVSGGVELSHPWELLETWAEGRTWSAFTDEVAKDDVAADLEEGDSAGTAHAVCLKTS
ncbi:hypothetical protein [Kitasatospora sp. NPDC004289]